MKRRLLYLCTIILWYPVFAAPPFDDDKPATEKYTIKPITGKVTDGSGSPLAGATVQIKGTNIFTTTAEDGSFYIDAPDNATTLIFSYSGMGTIEEIINGRTNIQVQPTFATVQAATQ